MLNVNINGFNALESGCKTSHSTQHSEQKNERYIITIRGARTANG